MSPATVVKKKRASAKAVTGLGAAAFAHQQLKKGPWTAEEDTILKNYMMEHEEGNWNALPKNSGLQRCGKSCRLRWVNQLRPDLKKGPFSPEEELLICQLHNDFGNKWAHMAKKLTGRSDNKIKNYWNTRINRRKRAGLPPEIQHHVSLRSHEQGQNAPAPWLGNSLPALKPSQSTLSSSFISATPLLSQNQYESVFQSPNRVKNISFGSPCFTSPIQHGLENFDLGPPSYSGKTELPSSQFPSNYWGEQMPLANSGLLSDLFQASHMEGKFLSSTILAIDLFGIKVVDEMLKANGPSAIDMILAEMAPPKTGLPDLYNNCSSGGEFSNCPSSVTTDEEIGLDVPQPEWNFDHCTGGI